MSWVRIDDSAMDHPKLLQLNDAQFRLWMRGLCYCQKHLTDGFIPDEAIKVMLGRAEHVKRLCDVGLWDVQDSGGFQVHDFLDWNDCRELAIARREAKAEEKRAHREKMKQWREAKKAGRGHRDGLRDASQIDHDEYHGDVSVPLLTTPHHTTPLKKEQILTEAQGAALPTRAAGTTDPEVARRAGEFYRAWCQLYTEHRLGAVYHGRPSIDFVNCCNLVVSFSNDRLCDLAIVFLNSNQRFIEESNRSLAVFESRVTWCDEQLRKAQSSQRRSA